MKPRSVSLFATTVGVVVGKQMWLSMTTGELFLEPPPDESTMDLRPQLATVTDVNRVAGTITCEWND
jgi:hypothetical protein